MVLEVDFLPVGGCERNGDAIEFFSPITLYRVVRHERARRTESDRFLCRNAGGLACKIRFATGRKEMN